MLGLYFLDEGRVLTASYLVFLAAFFDFCDGFVARALKVDSPLGKQLDSLADVVTFGVLPFFLMKTLLLASFQYQYLNNGGNGEGLSDMGFLSSFFQYKYFMLPLLIIPVFSALRLAKFNIDTRQSHSFIGLPTPANGLFVASLPIIFIDQINFATSISKHFIATISLKGLAIYHDDSVLSILFNPYALFAAGLIFAILLVSPLPLFAMKFKGFAWKGNQVRFIFLALLVVTVTVAAILGKVMAAVPILVILYILISIINNITTRNTNEV